MQYYSDKIDEEIIIEIKQHVQKIRTQETGKTNTEPTIFIFENFPLNIKQVLLFEKEIANVFKAVFIQTPEELIEKKLSFETKEVAEFNKTIYSQILSVYEYFRAHGKVEKIDGTKPFLEIEKELIQKLSL